MSISLSQVYKDPDKITKISLNHKHYPPLLAQIADPPKNLYLRGNLDLLLQKQPTLAIVGTRKATAYGLGVAEQISAEASLMGIVIISGLARGIDTTAHQGCLKNHGHTIAVLGTGLADQDIYPRENKKLAQQIVTQNGLLVSEYPAGTEARKFHFPARNRIIAGLSQAVAVIEAPTRSGALITADFAADYNRDLLALPGPITSHNSQGPNQLLAQGATPLLGSVTLREIFNLTEKALPKAIIHNFSEIEKTIINLLKENQNLRTQNLIEQTNFKAPEIAQALSNLELENVIKTDLSGALSLKSFDIDL